MRPKKAANVNNLVRMVENDLDKYGKQSYSANEPLPVNLTREMMNTLNPINTIKTSQSIVPSGTVSVAQTHAPETISEKIQYYSNKILNSKHRDILASVLLFMILNNKFIIEFIYDKIPYMKAFDSPYPNLVLRSIFYGLILLGLKKFSNT